MISLSLARRLKEAGLVWHASINDFFGIPDREMDERVFVITDLMASLDLLQGWPVVTFHGTAEWALDYILTTEVVWLPTEEQLRAALQDALAAGGEVQTALLSKNGMHRCVVRWQDSELQFDAASGSEAYGLALLDVLQKRGTN